MGHGIKSLRTPAIGDIVLCIYTILAITIVYYSTDYYNKGLLLDNVEYNKVQTVALVLSYVNAIIK